MTDEDIIRVLDEWIEDFKSGTDADRHVAIFFMGLRDRFIELIEGK